MTSTTCRKRLPSPRRARRCLAAALLAAWILTIGVGLAVAEDKSAVAEKKTISPAVVRLVETVDFLASDEMQGRGLGTKGLDRAASYIRRQFVQLGLKTDLCDGGAFQTFVVPVKSKGHGQNVDWWSMFEQAAGNDGASTPKSGTKRGGSPGEQVTGPPLRYGPGTPAQDTSTSAQGQGTRSQESVAPKSDSPKDSNPRTAKIKNVVAVLEGAGPLADETIVVGAHYDHLGQERDADGRPITYNGANDNASGTAALVEVARMLSKRERKLPRRVVFVAFSGEEQGLLGSLHYVAHPPVPLEKTIAMVNLDMIGRMDGSRVMALGLDSSPAVADLAERAAKEHGIRLLPLPGNLPCSDHAPFYSRGIPVVHFITFGGRGDYHEPSDDAEKLNYEGIERITLVAADLTVALAESEKRPEFTGGGLRSLLIRGAVRFFGEAVKESAAKRAKPKETTPVKEKEEEDAQSPGAAAAPGKPGR